MNTDLSQKGSLAQFASIVGVSRQAMWMLMQRGGLPPDGTLGEWLLMYCERMRTEVATRSRNLLEERAGLAREQKLLARIKKQRALGEWAPVENLALVLSRVTSEMTSALESVPNQLAHRMPWLTAEQLALIRDELGRAGNLLASAGIEAIKTAAVSGADYAEKYDEGAINETTENASHEEP